MLERRRHPRARVRLYVVWVLADRAERGVFEALAELARDAHDEVRFAAVAALARRPEPEALAALRGRFDDPDPLISQLARASIDQAELAEAARQEARDSDPDRRAAAALALAGQPDATADLIALTADPDPRVRGHAVAALHGHPGPAVVAALISLLTSLPDDDSTGAVAARSLAGRNDPDSVRALAGLLIPPSDPDRLASAARGLASTEAAHVAATQFALARPQAPAAAVPPDLAHPDVVPTTATSSLAVDIGAALVGCMESPDELVRQAVAAALAFYPSQAATTALVERLTDPVPEVRAAAAQALDLSRHDPIVLAALIARLGDDNDAVRVTAARRIGNAPTVEALRELSRLKPLPDQPGLGLLYRWLWQLADNHFGELTDDERPGVYQFAVDLTEAVHRGVVAVSTVEPTEDYEPNLGYLNQYIVVELHRSNGLGEPVFSYLRATGRQLRRLLQVMQGGTNFRAIDYGSLLVSGTGRPDAELADRMRRRYGMIDVAAPTPTAGPAGSERPTVSPFWVDCGEEEAEEEPVIPADLADRAADLLVQFDNTGDVILLEKAIELLRRLVTEAVDDEQRADRLGDLGIQLSELYDRTGDPAALREAAECDRTAVAITPADGPDARRYRRYLFADLVLLVKLTGDPDVAAEAIALARAGLALTAVEDTEHAFWVGGLGLSLTQSAQLTGDTGAAREAATRLRAAVAEWPDYPDRGAWWANLGYSLMILFWQDGGADWLSEAIAASRRALEVSSGQDLAIAQANLSGMLSHLFELTNDIAALTDAVATGRLAAAGLSESDPDRFIATTNLALALRALFEQTGDRDLGQEAVRVGREAVAGAPESHPIRAVAAGNLGSTLLRFNDRTSEDEALREAIDLCRLAVATIDPIPYHRATFLVHLAAALRLRYVHTGDRAALAEALTVSRSGLLAATFGDPHRGLCLTVLGSTLLTAYLSSGDLNLLREATSASRAALAEYPPDHILRTASLVNYSITVGMLSREVGDRATMREAVTAARLALAATPAGHLNRPSVLFTLGSALLNVYVTTGDSDVGRELLAIRRVAPAPRPTDQFRITNYTSSISTALFEYARRTGNVAALREAADLGRAGVADGSGAPSDDGNAMANLGVTLLTLAERTGDPAALHESREMLARAIASPTMSATRLMSAHRAKARADALAGDHEASLASLESAVDLLPLTAPRELARLDREHRLEQVVGIGGQAIAAALRVGRPQRAVALAEAARGRLLGEAMDERSVARLAAEPDLSDQFDQLRNELTALDAASAQVDSHLSIVDSNDPALAGIDLPARRQRATARWESLLANIRVRPGFADFLATPTVDQLRTLADRGPIIIVSADSQRGDALVLTNDPREPVRHVALPGLTYSAAVAQADRFHYARATSHDDRSPLSAQQRAQATMTEVLAWLWDTAAGPILAALGHDRQPTSKPWPRIWWCPVGVLGYLPLHAAGHHEDLRAGIEHPRAVLDRVISSYTATIRALAYAREKPARPDRDHGAAPRPDAVALIVAMPSTPGAVTLPGIDREVARLQQFLPGARVLLGPQATPAAVRDALPEHPIAHFACHGVSDWSAPGQSRLVLHDDRAEPLTVTALSRLQLQHAELAFLSACSTTDTSPRLTDEAVHITAAFQLAGYRHVIGTLWPVNDSGAVRIATNVYAVLTGNGSRPVDSSGAAEALHDAVRQVRQNADGRTPSRWAAHIHTGG
jgi:HEAT repeat protein